MYMKDLADGTWRELCPLATRTTANVVNTAIMQIGWEIKQRQLCLAQFFQPGFPGAIGFYQHSPGVPP